MRKQLSLLIVFVMLIVSSAALAEEWTCSSCGNSATGNFCSNCGAAKPSDDWTCPNCGYAAKGNFCSNCGTKRSEQSLATLGTISTPAPVPTATLPSDVLHYGNFSYVLLQNGDIQIVRYDGSEKRVTISSEMNGHDVTSIAASAFQGCSSMESITIWADLTEIGDYAFQGCSKLKKISIPGDTRHLGSHAFEGCSSLESVTIWGDLREIAAYTFKDCTSLKKVSIPSSASYIGDYAFYNCPALKAATIWGDSDIGHHAFQGCSSLEKISISSGTKYIGNYAFEGCTSLAKVTMWGRKTSIGVGAFDNCTSLTNTPTYPTGTVPEESSSTSSETQAIVPATPTAKPTPTPVPTATIKPTVPPTPVPTATPIPYSDEFLSFIEGTESNPLTYEEMLQIKNDNERLLVSHLLKTDVELPQGQYVVGEDLPVGNYTISAKSRYSSPYVMVSILDLNMNEKKSFEIGPKYQNDVSLSEGDILIIKYNVGYEIHAYIKSK